MQRIDNILELATDLLNSYGPVTVPLYPQFKERATLYPKWIDETLPTFIDKMMDIKQTLSVNTPYLVSDQMTIGDIVMFSHFWRLAYNPLCDDQYSQQLKSKISEYKDIQIWCD